VVSASPAAPNPYSAGIIVEPAHRRCYAIGGREGIILKKSLPWIVFFGGLLLLVFSNSAYVKMFDCPVACSLRDSGRFFDSPGLVQVETSPRRRSKQQCRLARCGRPFPFFRGALVPRRFEAVKQTARLFWVQAAVPAA
jgi:hypothetical protein